MKKFITINDLCKEYKTELLESNDIEEFRDFMSKIHYECRQHEQKAKQTSSKILIK